MKKIAFIFPGQGSQSVGMGKDLYDGEIAKHIYAEADRILDKSISGLCFEGPEDELKRTVNTQPAILTTSIALYEIFKSKTDNTIIPTLVAGHSLGEYGAMYVAGVLDLTTALKLIAKRAEEMNKSAEQTKGAMTAVLGLNAETVLKVLENIDGVSVANFNSPEQIVITGEVVAMEKANLNLKEAGAKRVIPLPVSGAFHSELMKTASVAFGEYLQEFRINDARIGVLTNVDAEITLKTADFVKKMPKQIYSSVEWVKTIERMVTEGIEVFIEIGPGKVLAGLNKKINPEITTYNVFDKQSMEDTINALMAKI